MAAVDIYDTWESLVSGRVRRAPVDLVRQILREILRDFLQFTRAWQYEPAAQNIVATQATYALLTPGAYAEPVAAEWVQVSGGKPATARTVDWLDENITDWRTAVGDNFQCFVQERPSSIRFPAAPVTPAVGALRYRVSLKPVMSATQVDDTVFNDFGEEVAAGARGRLLNMDGETWANPKLGTAELATYAAGRGKARVRVQKRYANVEQHWRGKYRFA